MEPSPKPVPNRTAPVAQLDLFASAASVPSGALPTTGKYTRRGRKARSPDAQARLIGNARVPDSPEEQQRLTELYWETEWENQRRAAAQAASKAAVAAAVRSGTSPKVAKPRQRQHQRRRPTGRAAPSEDGPEPSAPGRALHTPTKIVVALGPPNPEAVARFARLLVEKAAAEILAKSPNQELQPHARDGWMGEAGGHTEAAPSRKPRRK